MAETILYIDDQPQLPEGFARELRGLGYELTQTADPKEGLRLARSAAPGLILLEVLIDSGRGFELLETIRSWRGPRGSVPVLILTRGVRSPTLFARSLELAADDFICKPVLCGELLAAVRECTGAEPAGPVDPGETQPVTPLDAAFSGDLADCPLPELLLRLRRIGATGVLLVQHETENRGIQLRNGSPVAVASNRGAESLEDFLVRTKRISGREHEEVSRQVLAGLGSVHETLVRARILREAELEEAEHQRAAEPLLEGFAWRAGTYRFLPEKQLKPDGVLEFERGTGRLLLEGVLQWTPSEMIRDLLERRSEHYISKVERPVYTLEELEHSAADPALLEALTGDRTVDQVLATQQTEARLLYALLVAGLVEVHPEPTLLLGDVVEPEAPASAPPEPEPAAADDDTEHLEFVEDEDAEEIEAQPAPTPLPEDAEAGEVQDQATRSLEAERWFRKGEQFLQGKRYGQAIEAFGMAAHLDPGEGEYSAHLGYVLHLANPTKAVVRREALEHIAKGIKLAPRRWKPLVFLGRAFKADGELENARKVFGRALKIQPDCREAQLELRLLERRAQPRGWLQNLVGRWTGTRRRR